MAVLKMVLGLLAPALLLAPLTLASEKAPDEKPAKVETAKDEKTSDVEKADSTQRAPEPSQPMSEEELKKALKKYDANGNGRLDDDELARMKADEKEASARRSAAAEKKVDVRTEKRIDQAIKKGNKVPKKR